MAIRSKSLDDMIREIIVSLKTGEPKRPAFTLLVGSGFSFPIIPTPTQMLRGDIAWWRYWKDRRIAGLFCSRTEAIAGGKATESEIVEFEREMWKPIHTSAATSKDTAFGLTADGLPDLTSPNSVGLAYQAVMADGLLNNKMRRQYLRAAIERSHPKVNGAHIFLAGILEAQETWEWGAPFCRTIFTTNFDPLLQRSLQLVNKLYYMTDRPDVLEPPDDDQSEAIHLVYTHGSVHRYDLLNTEDEIKKARERNAPTLIDYFRRHGVIVMGYSGWADTTMEALLSCASFDSNLYWCDIHSVSDAERRLRPDVLKILEAQEKHAYYIPITGADETMSLLHGELNLGAVPKFIRAPVETMITQLKSIEVPSKPAASDNSVTAPLSTSLKELLDGTLKRLEVAESAFNDPSIVRLASAKGEEAVAEALIAQLMSDAFVAYSQGDLQHAVDLWTIVIDTAGVPPKDRARALRNRGVAFGDLGDDAREIADYTEVIDMPDAPADQKAMTLNNRGYALGERGETTSEMADYTAVIDMPDVPAEDMTMALLNRGITWGQLGRTTEEIADYTTIIDMPNAPADQKAKALNNRGLAWGKSNATAKEIDDYTRVIEMPEAPSEQKAMTLNNRGLAWVSMGEMKKAIADFTAVIERPDAGSDEKANAYTIRGWRLFVDSDDVQALVADSRKALDLCEDDVAARSNLALGLFLLGEADTAVAEYDAFLSRTSDAAVIGEAIDDLTTALRKRPEIAGVAKILDRLRDSMPLQHDDLHTLPPKVSD
jgi:hypothetical protein